MRPRLPHPRPQSRASSLSPSTLPLLLLITSPKITVAQQSDGNMNAGKSSTTPSAPASAAIASTSSSSSLTPTLSAITSASGTSTAAAGAAVTHVVSVGQAEHKFKPDVTVAGVGDIIEFQFFPPNHSVVRSAFGFPCIPYEMTGSNRVGFFSGFHALQKILDDPPKWQIRINDTDPIFFYCSATGSCMDWGMVGAINPNSSTPISTQHDLALNSSYQLQPGDPFPSEGRPSSLPSQPTSPIANSPADPPKTRLSPGVIAAIVIAGISVIALGALLFFYMGRLRSLKDEVMRKSSTIIRTGGDVDPSVPIRQGGEEGFTPRGGMGGGMVEAKYMSSGNPYANTAEDGGNGGNGVSDIPRNASITSSTAAGAGTVVSRTTSPRWSPRSASPPSYHSHSHSAYHYGPGPGSGQHNAYMVGGAVHPAFAHGRDWYHDGAGVQRNASHRSMGGTFDLDPMTGYYKRTHEDAEHEQEGVGEVVYKYAGVREGDGDGDGAAEVGGWVNEGRPVEMDGTGRVVEGEDSNSDVCEGSRHAGDTL